MGRIGLPFPGGIAGQLAALMVTSLVLIHLVAFVLFSLMAGPPGPPQPPDALAQRQMAAIWLLNRTGPDQRAGLLRDLLTSDADLGLRAVRGIKPEPDWAASGLPPHLHGWLTGGIEAAMLPGSAHSPEQRREMLFRLADGGMIAVRMEHAPPPFFGGPVFVTLIFLAVSLLVLWLWAMRNLIGPLRRFSHAVERFGSGGVEPVQLAEQGPDELRRAAAAFNHMQGRINRLMSDRTGMLLAVGHDLRTPITRLRLRADFIKDDEVRGAFLADLAHMDALLQGALTYLRDGRSGEQRARIDLLSLLQSIADQWSDAGHPVGWDGAGRMVVSGRPTELKRLFGNLVENAVTHGCVTHGCGTNGCGTNGGGANGGEVRISLSTAADNVQVDIADHGPGIAADQKPNMVQPFTRGDGARNMDGATGLGLGLAICQAIAKGHGGTLELHDTPGGGLTARVILPCAARP